MQIQTFEGACTEPIDLKHPRYPGRIMRCSAAGAMVEAMGPTTGGDPIRACYCDDHGGEKRARAQVLAALREAGL